MRNLLLNIFTLLSYQEKIKWFYLNDDAGEDFHQILEEAYQHELDRLELEENELENYDE